MNALDWGVIAVYGVMIIWAAALLGRSQKTLSDYYLGGRTVRWWQSGLSTMATQLGAISFVSAPAFVVLKEGGGMKWLAYELGVPLALILVMAVILPTFHRAGVISIYEYLEKRFDQGTRTLVSILFQIGRGLATAVSVLAGGLILSTALGISTTAAVLAISLVTIIYDILGGIRVVILSDVIQMGIILAGILVCGAVALSWVGWQGAWSSLSPERLQILDFHRWGVDAEGTYAFWPMVLGGFFLYASYYGCDQSQVQRELTVGKIDDVKKSLLLNALGRFPMVLLYCTMGVFVGAVVATPGFLERAAAVMGVEPAVLAASLERDPDRMVPLFILSHLPHGVIGFLFVAILSALMSSLDSALNSMSAVTMRDFYQRRWVTGASETHYLLVSRGITLFWGFFCVAFALLFGATPEATRQTTIVLINAIGSVLYGPILAAFLLGMITRWAGPRAVKTGILSGVALNLGLWQWSSLSWLWWNATGFITAVSVTAAVSLVAAEPYKKIDLAPVQSGKIRWPAVYGLLGGYFFAMVLLSWIIERAGR